MPTARGLSKEAHGPRAMGTLYLYATLYVAWTSPFARGFRVTFFDRTIWGAVLAFPVGVWIMGWFR